MTITCVLLYDWKSILSYVTGFLFVALFQLIFNPVSGTYDPGVKCEVRKEVLEGNWKEEIGDVSLDSSSAGVMRDMITSWRTVTVQAKLNRSIEKVKCDLGASLYVVKKPLKKCCICLGDEQEQMITLRSCGHSVHQDCIKGQLSAGWTGKRISFGFLTCGECRTPISHKKLTAVLAPHYKLKREVEDICYKHCRDDDLIDELDIKLKENYKKTKEECCNMLSCFICTVCSKPFSGGKIDCADDNDLDISTIKCASCAFEEVDQKEESDSWRGKCHTHGYKYAMYKCDSCCSLATFDCRSNHYCSRCHDMAYSAKNYPCPGPDLCPLGVEHPPNQSAIHGEDRNEFINGFVIGCFKCFTKSEDVELDGFGNEPQWQDRF